MTLSIGTYRFYIETTKAHVSYRNMLLVVFIIISLLVLILSYTISEHILILMLYVVFTLAYVFYLLHTIITLQNTINSFQTNTETKISSTQENSLQDAATDPNLTKRQAEDLFQDIVKHIPHNEIINLAAERILMNMSMHVPIISALFYHANADNLYTCVAKYAYASEEEPKPVEYGKDLTGQVAKDKDIMYVTDIPPATLTALSGLGNAEPLHLAIIPILKNNNTVAIIELATFEKFNDVYKQLFISISENMYNYIKTPAN